MHVHDVSEIEHAEVMRLERLLDLGRTPAEAADAVGVAWRTAAKVAAGRHPRQLERAQMVRCPGCGGLVMSPCRLCAVRAVA